MDFYDMSQFSSAKLFYFSTKIMHQIIHIYNLGLPVT